MRNGFLRKIRYLSFVLVLFLSGFSSEETLDFAVYPTQLTVAFGAENRPYFLRFVLNNTSVNELIISSTKLTTQSGSEFPATFIIDKEKAPHRYQVQAQLRATGNQHNTVVPKLNEDLTLVIQYVVDGKTRTLHSPSFQVVYATGYAVNALTRKVTINNRCDFPVWVGAASNSTKNIQTGQTCQHAQDCFPGSTCVKLNKSNIKRCFWNAPVPEDQQYRLEPSGNTTLNVSFYDNGLDTFWEGAIAARTDCTHGACQTADCGTAIKGKNGIACRLGQTFSAPASIVRLALKGHSRVIYNTTPNGNAAHDVYSVSVADGIHVPIAITPNSGSPKASAPYECGAAGAANNQYPLGSCSWEFSPPKNDFRWVSYLGNAAKNCESDKDCAHPELCGISFNPLAKIGKQLTKTCGQPLGFWTSQALCAKDPYFKSTLFDCRYKTQELVTLNELFGCSKGTLLHSCYGKEPNSHCCGCVDWESVSGVKVPSYPLTQSCKQSNSSWTLHAQPKLVWLKMGCPTASVYPHDEASSHFQCQTLDNQKINTTHYTVTFCP